MGSQAKVVYGLLQATPHFREDAGHFTYTELCALTGLSRNTLKLAISELVKAQWIEITQKTRRSPLQFALGTPEEIRSRAAAGLVARRLKRAKFRGEALMQEFLSLLIDSDQYTDNARPGFLVNPLTGERLELDRYYPPLVAFEYHGDQHFHETLKYSQQEVEAQHLRDLIKAGLCLYQGIHLVIVRAEDLSLQGMSKKIGRCLPLRTLAGQQPLIDLLEEESMYYRAAAGVTRKPGA